MTKTKIIAGAVVIGLGIILIGAVRAFRPNEQALLQRNLEVRQQEYSEFEKEKEIIEKQQNILHLESEAIRAKLDFILASSKE